MEKHPGHRVWSLWAEYAYVSNERRVAIPVALSSNGLRSSGGHLRLNTVSKGASA